MKKFLVLSSWSAAIGSMLIAAFAVVGCDDSSSASAGPNDEPGVESSSSIERGSSSSGSVDPISSSSFQGDKLSSCSGENETSSSSVNSNSSSSVIPGADEESSSNKTPEPAEGSSSSEMSELSSNSSLGFDWNLPKEAYFNSDIDYGTMTDSRDGKVYKTAKIGDQVWMAENLNYYDTTDLSVKEKSWCFGKNDNGDSSTCDVAGRLYTWAAAIDSVKLANDTDNSQDCGYGKECGVASTRSATLVQGVCPTGWHLPSKTEWNALFSAVGDESIAGKVLKSQTGWYNRGNGTDAFGFSALPAGGRNGDEDYYNEGDYAYFWSSTELNSSYAYRMYLDYGSVSATLSFKNKDDGFSVRCVKN